MKLTMDQVKRYLAQKGPEDFVGEPMAACGCLAAETLIDLYPNSQPVVDADNLHAHVWIEGERIAAELNPDVTEAANKFDKFPDKFCKLVTRSELEAYMPELFDRQEGD